LQGLGCDPRYQKNVILCSKGVPFSADSMQKGQLYATYPQYFSHSKTTRRSEISN
jgi:hypothetical protein